MSNEKLNYWDIMAKSLSFLEDYAFTLSSSNKEIQIKSF